MVMDAVDALDAPAVALELLPGGATDVDVPIQGGRRRYTWPAIRPIVSVTARSAACIAIALLLILGLLPAVLGAAGP